MQNKKFRCRIERYLKGANFIGVWYFSEKQDHRGNELLMLTAFKTLDKRTRKILNTTVRAFIPQHVNEEARKKYGDWKHERCNTTAGSNS